MKQPHGRVVEMTSFKKTINPIMHERPSGPANQQSAMSCSSSNSGDPLTAGIVTDMLGGNGVDAALITMATGSTELGIVGGLFE